MIAVDTNIICYRWMPSAKSAAADALWQSDPHWIVPVLWRSEFRNVLAGALRSRLLALESALEITAKVEAQMSGHEYVLASASVLRLVAGARCSAYDCEFIALAREQGVPLVTDDRQVLREFPETAVSLETFGRR